MGLRASEPAPSRLRVRFGALGLVPALFPRAGEWYVVVAEDGSGELLVEAGKVGGGLRGGVPFQADGGAPVLAGLDGLHEAFAGAAPVCETKSLQQLPGIYIFNKKVNIAQQLEDTLHACRPEPATRTLKLP